MQAFDLPLAVEAARGIGRGLQALEKIAKTFLQTCLEFVAVTADQIAVFAVEAGKPQPVAQAACLSAPSLICLHVLRQCLYPITRRSVEDGDHSMAEEMPASLTLDAKKRSRAGSAISSNKKKWIPDLSGTAARRHAFWETRTLSQSDVLPMFMVNSLPEG